MQEGRPYDPTVTPRLCNRFALSVKTTRPTEVPPENNEVP